MGRHLSKREMQRRRAELRALYEKIDTAREEDKRGIGDSREHLVGEALQLLQAAAVIATFQRTMHGDEDDRHGKDYLVYDFDGNVTPLQVKGSWTGVREHCERHPEIPFVKVDRDQSVRQVAVQISRALRIPLPDKLSKE